MSLYIKEKPDYLKSSIESMLTQTVLPNQIVIVLDGPITVDLENIINEYKNSYPSLFTIVALKENLGLGLALNEGIKYCKNELIARMDTDDISYPERCELQLEEFSKNPSLDIVGTLTSEFYETPEDIVSSRIVPENHEAIVKFSKRRSPFNHPTVMYRKSSVTDVGGYRDILRNEDIDLFVRMIINKSNAKNIQKELLYFRSNIDNFKRRKSWSNNKNYIKVIFGFWKQGYSTIWDLIFVVITQLGMYLSPMWVLKWISETVLRGKSKSKNQLN
ncbi:MAG TPA: glycosyl transferase [Aerococcaceae bacterium]|nr:glycosyl transferase [Aerococcaceae bacterium]